MACTRQFGAIVFLFVGPGAADLEMTATQVEEIETMIRQASDTTNQSLLEAEKRIINIFKTKALKANRGKLDDLIGEPVEYLQTSFWNLERLCGKN